MDDLKKFILEVLTIEAEAWSIRKTPDLNLINAKVEELYSYAIPSVVNCFGINRQKKLKSDSYYKKNLEPKNSRHLFKLSSYKNKLYGDLWVGYVSEVNADVEEKLDPIAAAFIISKIEGDLKVIGVMSVTLDEMNMEPSHWKSSVYNPEDLDINNLGSFIATERYKEPKDDGFSMEDYLADR